MVKNVQYVMLGLTNMVFVLVVLVETKFLLLMEQQELLKIQLPKEQLLENSGITVFPIIAISPVVSGRKLIQT